MKSNKKIVGLLAGILIVLLAIVAVLLMDGKGENEEEPRASNDSTVSTVEQMIEAEEPFTIETKYCDIYYPAKWEKEIETQIEDSEDMYKVEFFGKLEGKEKQHIFDIVFGGEEGALVGHLSIDGEDIPVYVVGMEIETSEDWTDEELNIIYMMQEDVNYILGMLEKEENFRME